MSWNEGEVHHGKRTSSSLNISVIKNVFLKPDIVTIEGVCA